MIVSKKSLPIEEKMIKEMERLYLTYGFPPTESKNRAEWSYDVYKMAEVTIMDEEYSPNS